MRRDVWQWRRRGIAGIAAACGMWASTGMAEVTSFWGKNHWAADTNGWGWAQTGAIEYRMPREVPLRRLSSHEAWFLVGKGLLSEEENPREILKVKFFRNAVPKENDWETFWRSIDKDPWMLSKKFDHVTHTAEAFQAAGTISWTSAFSDTGPNNTSKLEVSRFWVSRMITPRDWVQVEFERRHIRVKFRNWRPMQWLRPQELELARTIAASARLLPSANTEPAGPPLASEMRELEPTVTAPVAAVQSTQPLPSVPPVSSVPSVSSNLVAKPVSTVGPAPAPAKPGEPLIFRRAPEFKKK